MRKLERLCKRYNRQGDSKLVVFRVPKSQYGYKYLVRYSPDGTWIDDQKYHFDLLEDVISFVSSFFR